VDLRRADPDALDVEHPVRAAMDPGLPFLIELDQVAVGPDSLVLAEIGIVEAAAVVVQESQGAGWKRGAADDVAASGARGGRLVRESLDVEPEAAGLDHPPTDGELRVTEDEAADDVRAARDRLKAYWPDLPFDPVELPLAQYRAGGED